MQRSMLIFFNYVSWTTQPKALSMAKRMERSYYFLCFMLMICLSQDLMNKKLQISKLISVRHLNLQILVISITTSAFYLLLLRGAFSWVNEVHWEAPATIQVWKVQANLHSYRSKFQMLISRQRRTNWCTLIPYSCRLFDIFVQHKTWCSICCFTIKQDYAQPWNKALASNQASFPLPQKHYGFQPLLWRRKFIYFNSLHW